MNWIYQNWLWILVGVGALLFFSRARGMHGCGMGHSGHNHQDGRDHEAPPAAGNRPGYLFDPVSRRDFAAGSAPISSVHGGRAYYFESRENREAFEADPEKYLAGAPSYEPAGSPRDFERQRSRRRHGC